MIPGASLPRIGPRAPSRSAGAGPAPPRRKKTRHRSKIDRLPVDLQRLVWDGYARGDTYATIRADLGRRGHDITEEALSRYWHTVWAAQIKRLREARAFMASMKGAFKLPADSASSEVADELLYTLICQMQPRIEAESPMRLLRELRLRAKAGLAAAPPRTAEAAASPVEEAQEVRRRWRQLYGLDEPEANEAKDAQEAKEAEQAEEEKAGPSPVRARDDKGA